MTTRNVKRGLGILVLLLTGAFGVSAQSLTPGNEILFYNQHSAMAAVGQFDDYGNFVTVTTYTPDFVPWTSVVSTPAGILYYSKQTGLGMLGRLDAMGNHTIITYYDNGEFGAGWTHVVSSDGYLFFYNSSDGSAMVLTTAPDGYVLAVPLYGFSPGWTHIVSTQNGLLFYSSNNGAGAVGLVNSGYVQMVDDGDLSNPSRFRFSNCPASRRVHSLLDGPVSLKPITVCSFIDNPTVCRPWWISIAMAE